MDHQMLTLLHAPTGNILVLHSSESLYTSHLGNLHQKYNPGSKPNLHPSTSYNVVSAWFNLLYKDWKRAVLFCFNFVRTKWKERGKHRSKRKRIILRLKICHSIFWLCFPPILTNEASMKKQGKKKCTGVRVSLILSLLVNHSASQSFGKDLIFLTNCQSDTQQNPGNRANQNPLKKEQTA